MKFALLYAAILGIDFNGVQKRFEDPKKNVGICSDGCGVKIPWRRPGPNMFILIYLFIFLLLSSGVKHGKLKEVN